MSDEQNPETQIATPSASDRSEADRDLNAPFPRSTAMQQSPQLSSAALTKLLIGMCLLPIITISVLWFVLDPAVEGNLDCTFVAVDLPDPVFYETEYWEREPYNRGELIVKNNEDLDWTHLNIQINGHYQIYDREPIPAGTSNSYKLDRFVTRSGAKFNLQYNPLKSARIYARRENRKRAIYYRDFVDGVPVEPDH